MADSFATTQVKGISLVEIIGRDTLAWRLVHDARPTHVCVIDSPTVPELYVVDETGVIREMEVQQSRQRTVISFETRSPLYSMIYWRPDFVHEQGGQFYLHDEWHAVEPRVFMWAFPPGAMIETLDPPVLHASLGAWDGIPIATAIATRITAEATYRLSSPERGGPLPPPVVPPPIATLAAMMPPAPGLSALLAQVRALCTAQATLHDSRVIRQIMGL